MNYRLLHILLLLMLTQGAVEFKSVKDVPPTNFLEQFGKDFRNTAWPAENGGLTMLNRVHHL